MIDGLNSFLTRWEGLWLFLFFAVSASAELYTAFMARKEFDYDKAKDDRRVRRTKTTKKTTKADGSVTEEQIDETIGTENTGKQNPPSGV